jgi:hypothetical protein
MISTGLLVSGSFRSRKQIQESQVLEPPASLSTEVRHDPLGDVAHGHFGFLV